MKTFIAPYKMGSESARDLARSLGALCITGNKRLRTSVVINWGRQDLPLRGKVQKVLNKPEAVKMCANKIATFRALNAAGVPTLDWTQDRSVALDWLDAGDLVYCRATATGSQGVGITVVGMDDVIPHVNLYTKGFIKTHEYRVHVAFGKVIDFSKKRKRNDRECSPYIKNYNNGWVFCRDGVVLPEVVKDACIKAVNAVGLDFGALDVLYKESTNTVKIAEINSAPGIEGSTLTKYSEVFRNYIYSIRYNVPTRTNPWGGRL